MASNSKKRSSAKALHIFFLRCLIMLGLLLLLFTLGLQIINVFIPVEESSSQPALLGHPSVPFRLTHANVFPFLLAPLLVLIVAYLYLRRYLSKNSISAMDHIPYFRKKPHTLFGRKFNNVFSAVTIASSAVLSVLCMVMNNVNEAWFGFVIVVAAALLLNHSSKTLRRNRRQYNARRRSGAGRNEQV